jgi:hypothetical protein
MAYFVSREKRFLQEVEKALQTRFDGDADISFNGRTVVVKVNSGYPREEKQLTVAQVEAGIYGGGVTEALDGLTFTLELGSSL